PAVESGGVDRRHHGLEVDASLRATAVGGMRTDRYPARRRNSVSENGQVRRRTRKRRARFGNPQLARLTDEQLLDLRFCDLDLTIKGTPLEERIAQLRRELAA